jgi:TonB family protein
MRSRASDEGLTLAIVLAAVFAGCAATRPVLPESEEVAGIAGEPIPLDSPKLDPKYKEKWAYPCVEEKSWLLGERCDYKAVELVIDFGILRDGRVPYVIVRRPSEFAIYNEFAVNAVKLAAPFPPIPESMLGERQGPPIRAAFKYVVDWRRP